MHNPVLGICLKTGLFLRILISQTIILNKMKSGILAILLFSTIMLAGCNEAAKKKPIDANTDTNKVTIADTTKQPEMNISDVVQFHISVKDYTTWKNIFDLDSVARKASGLNLIVIGRGMNKSNDLTIYLSVSDRQKAKDFANSPRLKEVREKAGVISIPDVNYYHILRFNPDAKEKLWVVVTHKVKDFGAWLKVFDAEGAATRLSQGFDDVVLARGIDDSNNVQLVFDIKDLTKAKAALASEEKIKLMESAGVIGKPSIEFYNTAE
ncbi:MAG TPA: hypothetical protein DCQ15_07030 [Chitinophagaceae bacterium]|jgi:hypothetical protein|nr:hypothetical protein [Chitinophagaceae bacterium]